MNEIIELLCDALRSSIVGVVERARVEVANPRHIVVEDPQVILNRRNLKSKISAHTFTG